MNILPRNEHTLERAARVILGICVLSLMFIGPRSNWGLLGVVPLLTGLLGSCPLYTLFGISTCNLKQPTKSF